MTVLYKQPSESKVFYIEFEDQLVSGDYLSTITSVTEETGAITIASTAILGTKVQATFSGGDDGTTYTITAIAVTAGSETLEVDVYLRVMESTSALAGELSFFTARTRIADDLGWTRQAGNWSSDEVDRLDEIINAGYLQFIYPVPLEGENVSHEWSFLRPTATIETIADTYKYDMATDFGAMVGDLVYDADEYEHRVVEQTSIGVIDRHRAVDSATADR